VKALIIIFLIIAVFGTGAYWTYELFVRPREALKEEKLLPAEPPPPDPSLPELEKAVALQKQGKVLEARMAFKEFLDRNPQSTKIEEARERLGEINSDVTLSSMAAPEKEIYIVRSGDVLQRVAHRMKTTPELIMRSNNMSGVMLRIGQKLMITPTDFSLVINKNERKVSLLNKGEFFKQYPIRTLPARAAAAPKKTARPAPKVTGKITEKIAFAPDGRRITFDDKDYGSATHWILSVSGNTLYSAPDENSNTTIKVNKPPGGGLGIAQEQMAELAALLSKGNPVTIEN
jgi:LysM repeat protein